MIALPAGVKVWLAALVQTQLAEDPFSGQLFVFRGRRGDRIKMIWWDGDGSVSVRQAIWSMVASCGRKPASGTVHLERRRSYRCCSRGSTGERPQRTHVRRSSQCNKETYFIGIIACIRARVCE
jgi:transposase